jgi:hypothetical protein
MSADNFALVHFSGFVNHSALLHLDHPNSSAWLKLISCNSLSSSLLLPELSPLFLSIVFMLVIQ